MGKKSSNTSDVKVAPSPAGKSGKKEKRNMEVDTEETSKKRKVSDTKSGNTDKRNVEDDPKKSLKKQKTAAKEVAPVKNEIAEKQLPPKEVIGKIAKQKSDSHISSDKPKKKPAAASKKPAAHASKKEESNSSSDEDDEVATSPAGKSGNKEKRNMKVDTKETSKKRKVSDRKSGNTEKRNVEDDPKKSLKKQKTAAKEVVPVKNEITKKQLPLKEVIGKIAKQKSDSHISSDKPKKKPAAASKKPAAHASKKEESDSSSDEDDEEKHQGVSDAKKSTENKPKTHDSSSQATQPSSFIVAKPNTIIVGNLSHSVNRAILQNFFQVAGEIVDIRVATFEDGSCKGIAQIEFAAPNAVYKACKLSGNELMGRAVTINFGNERPTVSLDTSSFKKPEWFSSNTVLITGFDSAYDMMQIRESVWRRFEKCGPITNGQVLADDKTGACKGAMFLEFSNESAVFNALNLDGSALRGFILHVEDTEQHRAANIRFGGGRGFGRRGRGGSGRSGRGRGSGRSGRGRGSGRRGRGGP